MYSSTSDANKNTSVPRSPSWPLGLAVGAVLVVLLAQQLGQDGLMLLVLLLRLLAARAGGHGGGGSGRQRAAPRGRGGARLRPGTTEVTALLPWRGTGCRQHPLPRPELLADASARAPASIAEAPRQIVRRVLAPPQADERAPRGCGGAREGCEARPTRHGCSAVSTRRVAAGAGPVSDALRAAQGRRGAGSGKREAGSEGL